MVTRACGGAGCTGVDRWKTYGCIGQRIWGQGGHLRHICVLTAHELILGIIYKCGEMLRISPTCVTAEVTISHISRVDLCKFDMK